MIPSENDILYSEYITVNWYGNQTKKSQGKKLIEKKYFLASYKISFR